MTNSAELSLRFTAETAKSPIHVMVVYTDSDQVVRSQLALFEPPLGEDDLADLRWYLGVFPKGPVEPDYKRAKKIEARLLKWGQLLLEHSIRPLDALDLWYKFAESPVEEKLITINAQDPRVLQLPWELLADQQGFLCSQGIGLRRFLPQSQKPASTRIKRPVRVLYVAPQRANIKFMDPRPAAHALLAAVEQVEGQLEVEFLYPPTFNALAARLRNQSTRQIHVLHFDAHGLYDSKKQSGVLLFEDEVGQPELVDAKRLSAAIRYPSVPLVVLNASESASVDFQLFHRSFPEHLTRAGVGSIVGMSYGFLADAAQQFTTEFYIALTKGYSVSQAVNSARRQLMKQPKRNILPRTAQQTIWNDESIQLYDWFVPVLYQQSEDSVLVQATSSVLIQNEIRPTLPPALADPSVPGGLPAPPPHGFYGRTHELLALERALAEYRVVVLHGLAGIGKTALAAEGARWLYRTARFPGGTAYVSFKSGTSLQQLCSEVAGAIGVDLHPSDSASDLVKRVEMWMREQPTLVILDNFDSLLEQELATPSEKLNSILDTIWRWSKQEPVDAGSRMRSMGSRVLIVTRNSKIPDKRFQISRICAHYELNGLSVIDALELASAVLSDYKTEPEHVTRQELVKLIGQLSGHPLALTLALPYLRDHSMAELTAQLQKLLTESQGRTGEGRHASLTASLDLILKRFSKSVRAALPDLAVFQGGAIEHAIIKIIGIDPGVWQEVREALESAGLASMQILSDMRPSFVSFHPALLPYLSSRLTDDRRTVLEVQYCKYYHELGHYLYENDPQQPREVRAIAQRELPNLLRSLDLMLNNGQGELAVSHAQIVGTFLDHFGRHQERKTLLDKIERLINFAGLEEKLTHAMFRLQSDQGEKLLQQGHVAEAESVFRNLLDRMERGTDYDSAYDRAVTLLLLGRCLEAEGRPAEAIQLQNHAFAELQKLGATDRSIQRTLAAVQTDLGRNLAATGRLYEAEQAYQEALEIMRASGDQRSVAVTLHAMGNLAVQRQNWDEALSLSRQAIEIARNLTDFQLEAALWHQHGLINQEQGNYVEAERTYRESLRLKELTDDKVGSARTIMEIARLCMTTGNLDEAELWYRRVLEIYTQTGDQFESSHALNNLAMLSLAQGRLDDAKRLAQQAVALKEKLGVSVQPWITYSLLARIAEAEGDSKEADLWRRREQDSYAAYPGAAQEIHNWEPLIVKIVQSIRDGNAPEPDVVSLLDQLGETEDWKKLIASIRRILTGERDINRLRSQLDRVDFLIVRSILAGIGQERTVYTEHQSVINIDEERKFWDLLIRAIAKAAQGGPDAVQAVAPLLDELAQQEDWNKLAGALSRILAGERDAQILLLGLDGTHTSIVVEILRRLGVDVETETLHHPVDGHKNQLAQQLQAIRQQIDEGQLSQAIADLHALDRQYADKNLNGERAHVFVALGDAYQKAFDLQDAQRRYADAARLFRSVNDARGEAAARYRLGVAYMRSNRVADARIELDQAIDLAMASGYEEDAESMRQTRKLLDDVEIN